jgi:hypothetical protein
VFLGFKGGKLEDLFGVSKDEDTLDCDEELKKQKDKEEKKIKLNFESFLRDVVEIEVSDL